MARLHLFRGEAQLEAALDELIRTRATGIVGVELGRGLTSIPRLLAEGAAVEKGIEIGRAAELLCVHLAAEKVGRLSPLPPSLRPALGRALGALRRAGVVPSSLRHVAPSLPDGARVDALSLADRLERYEQLLAGRMDSGGLQRLGLSAIVTAPIPSLDGIDTVDVHAPAPYDVLTRLAIEALTLRGLTVRCRIVEPHVQADTRWDGALLDAAARALDLLEADGGANVERIAVPLEPGTLPSVLVAQGPALEARAIARLVRDRLATLAPDAIVVAAPDAGLREHVRRALVDYDVPVASRAERHADDTSAYRLVRSIYALAHDGLAREPFARLLASPLLEPLIASGRVVAPGRLASLVRRALPESPARSWEGPLFAYVAGKSASRQQETSSLVQHVLAIRDRLQALPERGPLVRHLAALAELLDTLGLPKRTRRTGDGLVPSPNDEAGRARSDEQAALRIWEQLRKELPAAARRLGLADRSWSRREVQELVLAAWAEPPLSTGGARGAAVTLCALDAVPEGPLALLVVAGATDGALRAPATDILLHDETLNTLGRALGRPLFDMALDPPRRERLVLARALARARESWLTRSRTDDGGRGLLAGELVEQALVRGASELQAADERVPLVADARTKVELATRLLVEEHGARARREGLDVASRARLRTVLGPRLPRVEALVTMEQGRAAFFAGQDEGGAHDGRIRDESTLARLLDVLPGRADKALSASTLQKYVECPQKFWLESVVHVSPVDEATDELDERAGGALVHAALEELFTRWRDGGHLPLTGAEAEAEHLEAALAHVVERWHAARSIGNPVLFEQRRRALARLLRAVWNEEVKREGGLLPSHFEHPFERVEVPGGDPPVYVKGSIDRIDVSGTRAAVFDYKTGSLERPKKDIKEATWGDTSWQLPLYAAVVRAQLGVEEVSLVYWSLKEMKIVAADAPAWVRLDGGQFVERLWAQAQRMRLGHFEVRPAKDACTLCRLQAACRIVERRVDDGEEQP